MKEKPADNCKHLQRAMIKNVGKAINEYSMIAHGDRVLAGLSGGKDSLTLIECLSERRKHIPIDYDIIAIHVDITNISYVSNLDYLKDFCSKLKVSFIHRSMEIVIEGKNTCFLCSWNRRKLIFDAAKEYNCNRVALGHNMNDAVETLLMNMMYSGSISSMPPKLEMFDGELDLIRPLILSKENDIREFSKMKGHIPQKQECSYGDKTKRTEIRNLIEEMESRNEKALESLFASMKHIHKDYLP